MRLLLYLRNENQLKVGHWHLEILIKSYQTNENKNVSLELVETGQRGGLWNVPERWLSEPTLLSSYNWISWTDSSSCSRKATFFMIYQDWADKASFHSLGRRANQNLLHREKFSFSIKKRKNVFFQIKSILYNWLTLRKGVSWIQ